MIKTHIWQDFREIKQIHTAIANDNVTHTLNNKEY